MPFPSVTPPLLLAVHSGLDAAAVLGPGGEPLEIVGALDRHEVRALAALVSKQGPEPLLHSLFAGEVVSVTLDGTVFSTELVSSVIAGAPGERAPAFELVPPTLGIGPGAFDRAADRTAFLGIAGRCVFVVGVAGPNGDAAIRAMQKLCLDLDRLIRDVRAVGPESVPPPSTGPSGSGSAPAQAFAWPPDRGRGRSGPN